MEPEQNRNHTPIDTTATLRYLKTTEGLSEIIPSVAGEEAPQQQATYLDVPVTVFDGREKTPAFSLDQEGFTLEAQTTAVNDFFDDDQIKKIWEDEVKTLLLQKTGARHIEIFDHTRRAASKSLRQSKNVREPAGNIHGDYTALSGVQRLLDYYHDQPDTAVSRLRNRFSIVNVWRSTAGAIESAPLTLCDATTVSPSDLVAVKRRGKDRLGEIQLALPNEAHKWYYFPKMSMNEVLLIKTYDSDASLPTRSAIHSAFADPATPAEAAPRESIETRCFVFY